MQSPLPSNLVIVPHNDLDPETLDRLIEEFVSREGTEYGLTDVPLETKVSQIKAELRSRRAIIVFDHKTETCNIVEAGTFRDSR